MLALAQICVARRVAAAAAIALLSSGAGYAARAQPSSPAGAATARPLGVAEAVSSGRAVAVRDMGGAPADVIAALKVELRAHKRRATASQTLAELDRFADTSQGATLAYVPSTGPDPKTAKDGQSVGGAYWGIERRTPDGMAQQILLMRDGQLVVGAPHPADPVAERR